MIPPVRRFPPFLSLLALLCGCSSDPLPSEQMRVSHEALARVEALGVDAEQVDRQSAALALQQAEQALRDGDAHTARLLAERAELDARLAEARLFVERSERRLRLAQRDLQNLREQSQEQP